jgi:hypothetical protein
MLSTLPSSLVQSVYALELSEDDCPRMGGSCIDRALATSESEVELHILIRTVRAWNEWAATASRGGHIDNSNGCISVNGEDLWSILQAAHIPPRHLVTFCFLLLASPHSVRRSTVMLASALYLAVLEHSARTRVALTSVLQEAVLRKVQANIRAFARLDTANKESGLRLKKIKGTSGNVNSNEADNPFGDSECIGGETAEEAAVHKAWLSSPIASAFVADYLSACTKLFGAVGPTSQIVLPLGKHSELSTHLIETLIDLTRTDILITSKSGRGSNAAASLAAVVNDSSIPSLAFELMLHLLHSLHGTPMSTVQLILKHLLSSALLSFGAGGSFSELGAGSATLPRHLMRIHLSAFAFVRRLSTHALSSAGINAFELQRSLHCFMQHVLLRASDRAEFRKLLTNAVVKDLLGTSEQKMTTHLSALDALLTGLRSEHVRFIARMARNKRPTIRLMALELSEASMQAEWSMDCTDHRQQNASFTDKLNEADEDERNPTYPSNANPGNMSNSLLPVDESCIIPTGEVHAKILLALILARCSDASPAVRARALAALAHVLAYCAKHFTAGDDTKDSVVTEEQRQLRGRFAHMLSQRLSAAGMAAQSSVLHRTRSAPVNITAPMSLTSPVSKSFTFMHTPLQATLTSTTRRHSHGIGHENEGDLSFTADVTSELFGAHNASATHLPAFHPAQAGVRDILAVLYRRSSDDKALVRRAALQALECILLGATEEDRLVTSAKGNSDIHVSSVPTALACLTASDLQIFYDGTFDQSLSIRKQALGSLTALLRKYSSVCWPCDSAAAAALANLQRVWLGAVLPLINDRERSVADKCVEAVQDLLLTPATEWFAMKHSRSSASVSVPIDATVWHLFSAMDGEMIHYFQLVCIQLLKTGAITVEVMRLVLKEIISHCNTRTGGASMEDMSAEGNVELSSVAADRARACWVLLECAALHSGVGVDLSAQLRTVWQHVTEGGLQMEETSLLRFLSCIGHLACAGVWKREHLASIAEYLVQALLTQLQSAVHLKGRKDQYISVIQPSAELIKKQMWVLNSACAALDKMHAETSDGGNMPAWEEQLLAACEKQLESFVAVASSSSAVSNQQYSTSLWNEPSLCTALFTLGEMILQHTNFNVKTTLSPSIIQLVQTFVAPNIRIESADSKSQISKKESPNVSISIDAHLSTSDDRMHDSHPIRIGSVMVPLTASLRGHAFLTLGKLMLRSEILAKKNIALLVCELERTTTSSPPASPLVQNNVLLILCDLVRTYTSIVDPYLSSVTALLASPNRMLRKHTIMVINVLLQEEYIKIRSASHATGTSADVGMGVVQCVGSSGSSSMFYRYVRCLVDEDASIRALVQSSLNSIVSRPSVGSGVAAAAAAAADVHGTRMHMHFVELIYFLNQCHEHPLFNQFGTNTSAAATSSKHSRQPISRSTSTNDAPFSLIGPLGSTNAARRFELYRLCLATLNDEQKYLLTAKLHSDVLQVVVEDGFLTQPWTQGLRINDVVQDALLILASDCMQLTGGIHIKGKNKEDGSSAESLESELHELALAAEESAGDNAVAMSSKQAAHAAATTHAQATAKAKLLHKLLKKSTMESCVPILLELRSAFARVHSPLDRWLMHLLARLHNHFKSELDEIFAGNRMVAREITFDVRRWEAAGTENADVHSRWNQLDFSIPTGPIATSNGSINNDELIPAGEISHPMSAGGEAASTPIKQSSLSSLRVGRGLFTPLRTNTASPMLVTPALRRSMSTPSAAVAAVVAAIATPGAAPTLGGMRTPGTMPIMPTPTLIRRAPSTPTVAQSPHTSNKRVRRSTSGAVTPVRLVHESDAELSEDALTDDDVSNSENTRPLIRLALDPRTSQSAAMEAAGVIMPSSLAALRVHDAPISSTLWNVAVYEPQESTALNQVEASKKNRLMAGTKKRKQHTSPKPVQQVETEHSHTTIATSKLKRKANAAPR